MCAVMYMCVWGIDFALFANFSIGFGNCFETVVFFVVHFIISKSKQNLDYTFIDGNHRCNKNVQPKSKIVV